MAQISLYILHQLPDHKEGLGHPPRKCEARHFCRIVPLYVSYALDWPIGLHDAFHLDG